MHFFAFADLAGFTALTEIHGDAAGADSALRFYELVNEVIAAEHGETIKTVGDAVMLRFDDSRSAIASSIRIVDAAGGSPGALEARVGVHCGDAIFRDGDWFGGAVNSAARITAAARGGEVVVSSSVKSALDDGDEFVFTALGERQLKNLRHPIELFAVRFAGPAASLPIDPVCRMTVDPAGALELSRADSEAVYFCSFACLATYATAPHDYD